MRDGALEGVDQLGHSREDWAVVVGQFAVSGLSERRLIIGSGIRGFPFGIEINH
jgi:hypothetical protein